MELKRQNMHVFVEAARETLQNLWDELFYSEEQMAEFTPAFTGISLHDYSSDDLKIFSPTLHLPPTNTKLNVLKILWILDKTHYLSSSGTWI
jgi:hypothetical protein